MMKKFLPFIFLAALAVFAWRRHHPVEVAGSKPMGDAAPEYVATTEPAPVFHCDGRRYCSEMKTCEEARYFLEHCPGTRMDGDHDGLPCEDRCGH